MSMPRTILPKEYIRGWRIELSLNKRILSSAKDEKVVNPPVKPTIKKKWASPLSKSSLWRIPKNKPIKKQPIRFAENVARGYLVFKFLKRI